MKYRGLSSIRWMYMKKELKRKKMDKEQKKDEEQKKEILRLMELCYNLGQDNIRTGKKHRLTDLYDMFENRLKSNKDE